MQTQEQQTNLQRAQDLQRTVEEWVNRTFNFVQLDVYTKCNEYLFESIRQTPVESLVEDYIACLEPEDVRELKQTIADSEDTTPFEVTDQQLQAHLIEDQEHEIREWAIDSGHDENYPMLNTLFEFRGYVPDEWLDKAQEANLGVIEAQESFGATLFVEGCGYSLYAAHWIPLYLSIFSHLHDDKYANIDFSMM